MKHLVCLVSIIGVAATQAFAQTERGLVPDAAALNESPASPVLSQEEPSFLNEVVVIGRRSARPLKDAPVPIRVVDRREIEEAGDETAADAMTRIVGLQIDTTVRNGQTPQIQGFGSKHVLVLIDGRRATGRLADDFDLSRIPASSIERIEVLKGASSVLYGSDAIGGVVNIVTRRPKQGLHSQARISRDSLRRNEASLSVTGGNDVVVARLNANHQIGPAYDLDPKDIATTGNAYERNNVQLELIANATKSLELSAAVAGDEATSEGISLGARDSVIDMKTKGVGRSARLGGRYISDSEGEVRLELGESSRTYHMHDDQRLGDASDRRLDSKERNREGSLIASQLYAQHHETVAGVDVSSQTFESNQIPGGNRERNRNSVFIQHEWRPMSLFRIVPGFRYDHDSQFDGQLSKALALRFDPTEEVVLRASYGEGFRAPSFSELYLSFSNQARGYRVEGNSDLTPELSKSFQTSIAWQPHNDLWLSLGGFSNRVYDLIGTVRSQPEGVLLVDYANIENVRNEGIEVSGRARFARRWILGLDYMYLEARDETRSRMLEGRAMHSGSIQTRYEVPEHGINAALTVGLVGKRPFYTETPGGAITEWSKSYRAANLRFGKRFRHSFEMFAGVRNITDEAQEEFTPVPPRSYFGGMGVEL